MEHQFPKFLDVWTYLHLVRNLHHSHLETFLQWHTCRFFYPSSSASKHKFLLPCHKNAFYEALFSNIVTYCLAAALLISIMPDLDGISFLYLFFTIVYNCCTHWKHTFQYTLVGKCCLFTFTGLYSCFKENSYMLVRNPETWMVPVKVDPSYFPPIYMMWTLHFQEIEQWNYKLNHHVIYDPFDIDISTKNT